MDLKGETALTDLMNLFIAKCIAGAASITTEALWLLGVLAVIELALLLLLNTMGQGEDPFYLIAKKFLKFSFFAWLIQNWATGMAFTKGIFDFFDAMGAKAAGVPSFSDPAAVGGKGVYLAEGILVSVYGLSMGSIGVILLKLLLAATIFFCLAAIAIYMFVTKLQFYITSTLTTVLLPFGVNKHTSFLSEKAIGAIFSLGIKMMVLEFVLCITMPFLAAIAPVEPTSTNIGEVLRILIGCAGMALLALKAPGLAADLLSGSPSFGDGAAGAAGGAAKSAAGMAGAAAGGAAGAVGMAKAAANAPGGRGTDGNVSLGGTAKNLGKMLRQSMPDRQGQMQGRSLFGNAMALEKQGKNVEAQKNQTTLF